MRWGCLSLADVVLVMCCVGVCGASARWLQEEDSARASSLHWTLQLLLSSAAAKAAAVSFSCAVLLLGKALSTRGPLAEVAERWRSVHMARLEANSCTCVSIQQLRNRVLDELLQTAGFFAEEDFYMLVAPLMFWVVPSLAPFCFNLIGITLLGLLVGDSLKDILHVPRPSHPKLWTHSHSQGTSEEYGMPSTHAMNAVSNSLLFFMYTASDNEHVGSDVEDEGTVTVSTITSKGACQLAALWCTIICVSRLYLGVHTVDDVAAGGVLGLLMVRLWLATHLTVEWWLHRAGVAFPLCVLGGALLSLRTRAVPPAWTPSARQSANISGLLCGMLCTAWLRGTCDPMPELQPVVAAASIGAGAGMVVARLAVGLCICLAGETAVKKVGTMVFSAWLDEPKGYASDVVYIPTKFLAQCWMAAAISGVVPWALQRLSLW